METTIKAQSGHSVFVKEIAYDDLPEAVKNNESSKSYKTFYAVKNFDDDGVIFFYLAKEARKTKPQIVAFYCNGEFWSSYGLTFKEAIDGAQQDGWLYTGR